MKNATTTLFHLSLLLFTFAAPAATVPASAYVQSGLVAQWDGIDNAGTGVHDANATYPKELVSGIEQTLTGTMTAGDDYFTLGSGYLTFTLPDMISALNAGTATVEMRIAKDGTSAMVNNGGLIALGHSTRAFWLWQNTSYLAASYSYHAKATGEYTGINFNGTGANTLSFLLGATTAQSSYSTNGVHVGGITRNSTDAALNDNCYIGTIGYSYVGTKAKARMYSLRLYNRALTADEIAYNAFIDKVRFENPDGYRWNETDKKVEWLIEASANVAARGGVSATIDGVAAEASAFWTSSAVAVTLTPTPASGYEFYEWSGDTDGVTIDATTHVAMFTAAAPRTLKAIFRASGTAGVERIWTGDGGDGLWTTAANWSPAGVPAADDLVTIGAGYSVTCSVQTASLFAFTLTGANAELVFKEPTQIAPADSVAELRADEVSILNGAVVTHVREEQQWSDAKTNGWKVDGRVKISCVDLLVDAASKINCTSKGYYCHNDNVATGPSGYGSAGSPGHGGSGNGVYPNRTAIAQKIFGPTSDDPKCPVEAGSAGSRGDSTSNPGVPGGGTVRIAATGDVTIEGAVTADAGSSGGSSRKGGAGGSVWISCRTIQGSGQVSAAGAMNNSNKNTALCGGGMVAIHYDSAAQAAVPRPDLVLDAGVRFYGCRGTGDVGTLYLTDTALLRDVYDGTVGVKAGNLIVGDWSDWAPSQLAVSGNGTWIRFPSGAIKNWNLSGISVSGAYAELDLGGEEFFMVQRGVTPNTSTNAFAVTVSGNVSVDNYAIFRLTAAPTNTWTGLPSATLAVGGALAVGANGTMRLASHPMNGAIAKVTCDSLAVASSGVISADSFGFGGGTNGVTMASFGPAKLSSGGAAHGGFAASGKPVGDLMNPLLCGSGGGRGDSSQNGSAGGGVVYMIVIGNCENNGTISANGQGWIGSSSGAGAGGSVNITANTFTGSGAFQAHGGNGQQATNAGGGGRIALYYDAAAQAALDAQPTFTFNTYTYGNNTYDLTDSDYGTVYLPDATFAEPLFLASKFKYVNLALGDWTGFGGEAITLSGSRVRLMNCPSLSFESITLNNSHLGFGRGTACWSDNSGKRYYPDGERGVDIAVTGDVVVTNASVIECYGGITNGNGGVINVALARTNHIERVNENVVASGSFTVGGSMFVGTNAWVKPFSHPQTGGSVTFFLRDLEIEFGGGFDATSRGWGGSQIGEGPGAVGSYGGKSSGKVYGWAKMPVLPGSGAGKLNSGANGHSGGGLVRMEVSRSLILGGAIKADGNSNSGGTYCSGGSGGGVYVKAAHLECLEGAAISAVGGNGNANDGCRGGGGRVAVLTKSEGFTGDANLTVSVTSGTIGKYTAEAGTVHFGRWSPGLCILLR